MFYLGNRFSYLFCSDKYVRFLLIGLCLVTNYNVCSQELSDNFYHRTFNAENGLPSSETYFVHQDKKGFIWICTDRGVVRYDGTRFKTFTIKDGLVSNIVFEIHEDSKGRIWFVSYSNKLCYFNGNKIVKYNYNHILSNYWKKTVAPQKHVFIDKHDNVYFGVNSLGTIIIDNKGKIKHYTNDEISIRIDKLEKNYFISSHSESDLGFFPKLRLHSNFGKLNSKKNTEQASILMTCTSSSSGVFLATNNRIYDVNSGQFLLENPSLISLYAVKNQLWVGTFNEGVKKYVYKNGKLKLVGHYFKGKSVSSIYCDNDGGWWFSTLNFGVLYCPNLAIQNFNTSNGLISNYITSLAGVNENVYAGMMLSRYQQLIPPFTAERKKSFRVNGIVSHSSTQLYFSGEKGVFQLKNDSKKFLLYDWWGEFFLDNETMITGNQTIFRVHSSGKLDPLYVSSKDKGKTPQNSVKAIGVDNNKQLWIGTINGLFWLNKQGSLQETPYSIYKVGVSDIACNSTQMVVSTQGNGLIIFKNPPTLTNVQAGGNQEYIINEKSGLISDHVVCIQFDKNNRLWVGTSRGVQVFNLPYKKGDKTLLFTTNQGLISREVTALHLTNRFAYIGTKNGISRIEFSEYRPKSVNPNRIHIHEFKVNGELQKSTKKSTLPSSTSSISLSFYVQDYSNSKRPKYAYRINSSAEWIKTNTPELSLLSLGAGNYSIEVKYQNEQLEWSPIKRLCSFEIEKPFYQSIYFILLCVLFGASLMYVLLQYRIRQISKQHHYETTINQLKQRALSAQMNPHFIFNALNSIQSFLVFEENEKAEKYLLKFSALIRQTLANSRDHFIRIETELETLRIYMELEHMRFKQQFDFKINTNLSPQFLQYYLPPMLIQPYIENAIIHGVSSMSEGGKIEVSITLLSENELAVVIEDNGQGRQAAWAKSPSKHTSFGTKITSERLNLFHKQGKPNSSYTVNIIDKIMDGKSEGTQVKLIIPLLKTYDSEENQRN